MGEKGRTRSLVPGVYHKKLSLPRHRIKNSPINPNATPTEPRKLNRIKVEGNSIRRSHADE